MRLLRTALATLTSFSAASALLLWPASPAAAEPGETVTASVSELIAALPVQEEADRAGYSRAQFKHWVDADRNGCNTRNEILLAEAVVAPEVTGRCKITAGTGRWWSWYDEVTLTTKDDVDIDHMVPLAEAWDSGAWAWTAKEREEYANDLGDERSLLAVHDSSNQSKSDKDPAEWMPPAASATCRYIDDWLTVKTRWGLSIDTAEFAAINRITADCDDNEITVVLAR